MNDSVLAWPAFAPGRSLPAGEIRLERGVWGKVPGARTDFRWIARSDGLERDEDLARQLNLGSEDQPARAQLWRNRGDRWYAVGIYLSRAWDAAGRTDFLEKQVLAGSPPPGTPAALGALLLLPRVASFNAEVWWDRSGDLARADADSSLQLSSEEPEPLPIGPEDLAAAVRQGVDELREAVGHDHLARLYAQILAGRRPAWLTGVERPLSPRALAVLLLPLPRDDADSLSLAGWLPSNRASSEDLTRWDVIVLPRHLEETFRPQDVDPESETQGWFLAEALLGLDPELARTSLPPKAASPEPREPARSVAGRSVEPPPRIEAPRLLSPPAALRPRAVIPLPSPPAQASDLLRELHAFARTVHRRWLDLDRWTRAISRPEPEAGSLIPSWIATLQQQRPGHADEEQWKVKLDLLRSAALILRPEAGTLEAVGLPESCRVPLLLFALLLGKRDLLAEMGEDTLRQALRQSLGCQPSAWTRRLRGELVRWPSPPRRPWFQSLLQAELKATRPARS